MAGKGEGGRGTGASPASHDQEVGRGVALEEARRAASAGEVPVGAVVFRDGAVVARAHNQTVSRRDPTAHAELLAVQGALAVLHTDRLTDCTLYVTLEPCAQCAGAIVLAKLGRLVFGAYDDKAGMAGSVGDLVRHRSLNHQVEVLGGVREEECGALLQAFFGERRQRVVKGAGLGQAGFRGGASVASQFGGAAGGCALRPPWGAAVSRGVHV